MKLVKPNTRDYETRDHGHGARKQTGVSLIEVMIALAVLSIGLAGLAAMQISALQNVHSAHYRSMASAIALDFEERLWMLALNTAEGCPDATAYNGLITGLQTDWAEDNATFTFGEATAPKALKIPNMAVSIPDGQPAVTDVSGSPVLTVPLAFSWNEGRFEDTGESTAESFTYTVRVHCRPVPAA